MSQFFKDKTKTELIQEFGLSDNLVKRRLQLLGYKIFKSCALGKPVSERDLIKRVIFLNKTRDLGFVLKDLISGCKLSEIPKDDETTKIETEKVLESVEYYSDLDLEKLDVLDEARLYDKLPINGDVLEYGVKPYFGKAPFFRLEDEKDSQYLIDNETGKKIIKFESKLSPRFQEEFMKTVDDNFKMNYLDFYFKWSDILKSGLRGATKLIDERIREHVELWSLRNKTKDYTILKFFIDRKINPIKITSYSENKWLFLNDVYRKIFSEMLYGLKDQFNIRFR
jgi:hypothetical protein